MTETPTQKAVRESAEAAAARMLQHAFQFAALHAGAAPLFQKTMRRPGAKPVLVRVDWPGVLTVNDPQTGECLARSQLDGAAAPGASFAPGQSRRGNDQ
ncbi:MAG: hypothetical protein M9919_07315 [Burkholderiaceae bacterium]|nr:hypothetical protein [Burkholderiaceae bacterium]